MEPGRTIGRYRVLRVLGRGGMGVVLLARHEELQRDVALKLIDPGASELVALRFEQEGQSAARLEHPNIVRVFEAGYVDGQRYLAMEYVKGEALDQRLKRGPLPPDEATRIVEALARAMDYAHAQGVVHRDLKPANVLIDEQGTPRITDFGLGRILDGAENRLTQTGEIMGTPAFMAPEQAGGMSKGVDGRADVYALGATLFALLTGRPPFEGVSVMNVIHSVISKPAPALPPELPAALNAICQRCLQKDPAKRYASAGELAEALAAPSAPSRLPLPVIALAAVAVLGAIGGALWGLQSPGPKPLEPPPDDVGVTPPASETTPDAAPQVVPRLRELQPRNRPAPRFGHGMVYDVEAERVVLFGGRSLKLQDEYRYYADLWSWDGVTWEQLTVEGGPRARSHFGFAYDRQKKRVVVHGGCVRGESALGVYTQHDSWALADGRWTSLARSEVRGFHEATYDPGAKDVVMVGGLGADREYSADTAYLGDDWVPLGESALPGRTTFGLAAHPSGRGVVAFGGRISSKPAEVSDETWVLTSGRWKQVDTPGPPARSSSALVTTSRGSILIGGRTQDGTHLRDLWCFDGEAWEELPVELPCGLSAVEAAYDAGRDVVVIFGGSYRDPGHATARIFELDWGPPRPEPPVEGPVWREVHSAVTPPARWGCVMVGNPGLGPGVYLHSGRIEDEAFNDLWVFDGEAWREIVPAPDDPWPPARTDASACFDPQGDRLILYGGLAKRDRRRGWPVRKDWWSWSPQAGWKKLPYAATGRRVFHVLGYDPGRQSLILAAGKAVASGEVLADTWALGEDDAWRRLELGDGLGPRTRVSSAWHPRFGLYAFGGWTNRPYGNAELLQLEAEGWRKRSDEGPAPRHKAGLVGTRHGILLVGGFLGKVRLDDTWLWDGARWTELPTRLPLPIGSMGIAYDADRDAVVVFGGTSVHMGGASNRTFELRWPE